VNATETNRMRLERFANAVLNNDAATAESLLHPDFEVYEAEGLPYGGHYRGLAGWNELFARILATWSDLKIEPQTLIGKDDAEDFGWFMKMSGRSAKTGKPFEMTIFERWSVRDGKIARILPHYWDTHLLSSIDSDESGGVLSAICDGALREQQPS